MTDAEKIAQLKAAITRFEAAVEDLARAKVQLEEALALAGGPMPAKVSPRLVSQ